MSDGARLSLGPVLFFWGAERLHDFYARIAEEAPVDIVYLGEVVCAKRLPFLGEALAAAAERLRAAGKEVVLSSLALPGDARDLAALRDLAEEADCPVEANDFAAVRLLRGRPHVAGPYLNVYNEGTLAVLAENGAMRICPPPELPAAAVARLVAACPLEFELQIFGRQPLALSARCYHARSRGRRKDNCQYACGEDPDGMPVTTLDGQPFVAVNGIQTLSAGYVELSAAVAEARAAGVGIFRLMPQAVDMVAVAALYRDLLDGRIAPGELRARLAEMTPGVEFADGYWYGRAGMLRLAGGTGDTSFFATGNPSG